MEILVGCDPEVFVRNPNSKEFVSADNLIPGNKKNPFKVPKGAVQVDGMALEFNIEPASSKAMFVDNVSTVFQHLRNMLPGYQLEAVPVANFEPSYFARQSDFSKALGCEPDYNAYTGQQNSRPDASTVTFRTAAGHIHLGWTKDAEPFEEGHYEDCKAVVKQMDYYLGMWGLLMDPDPTRRKLYGKAGAFRPKTYGCEYRVLSNVWLKSPEHMGWVYDAAIRGIKDMSKGNVKGGWKPDLYKQVARDVIDKNNIAYVKDRGHLFGLHNLPVHLWHSDCQPKVTTTSAKTKIKTAW